MTTTDDPEVFAERWHNHVEEIENLKMTLHFDQFSELDEALDAIHDLVDDAAEEMEETQ